MRQYIEVEGDAFPPIDLFGAVLADGLHRYHAAKNRGDDDIRATVHPDDRDQAMIFAATANTKHGAPLTRTQRNEAVKRLLALTDWSERKIADEVGIHQTTVMNIHHGIQLRDELAKHLSPVELARIDDTKLYRIATLKIIDDRVAVAKAAAELTDDESAVFNEPDIRDIVLGISRDGQSADESIERVRALRRQYPIDPAKTMIRIIDSMGETTHLLTQVARLVSKYPETKTFVFDIDHGGFVFRDEYASLQMALVGLEAAMDGES